MIVTDEAILMQKSEKVTLEEGTEIIGKLREELKRVPGLGLSAPQIGIHKRVALICEELPDYGYSHIVVPAVNIKKLI